MSTGNTRLKKLRYHASFKAWTAHSETEWLLISDELYQKVLARHLVSKGIEKRTWIESLHVPDGAQEWYRQVEEENRLQEQFDFWKARPEVQVRQRHHM
jgi:hypothetical protein